MPINVEINETQAHSNAVKVGQFRTDGEGNYGFVTEGHGTPFNLVVIADNNFDDEEIPYINYGLNFGGNVEDAIQREFPYVVNGKITVEGYRK